MNDTNNLFIGLCLQVKHNIVTIIQALCSVEEAQPEFGQFFRDVSSMLKEKTGETGKNIII